MRPPTSRLGRLAAGYWRLVSLDWPRLTVAVACGDGNELGLRITVDGYPALAPAGEPWDLLARQVPARGDRWPQGRGLTRRYSARTGLRANANVPRTWPATGPRSGLTRPHGRTGTRTGPGTQAGQSPSTSAKSTGACRERSSRHPAPASERHPARPHHGQEPVHPAGRRTRPAREGRARDRSVPPRPRRAPPGRQPSSAGRLGRLLRRPGPGLPDRGHHLHRRRLHGTGHPVPPRRTAGRCRHPHPPTARRQAKPHRRRPSHDARCPGTSRFIAPRYARAVTSPADLGVHVLQAGGQWQSAYGRDAARIVRLTSARSAASRLQDVTRWLRSLTRTRRTRP